MQEIKNVYVDVYCIRDGMVHIFFYQGRTRNKLFFGAVCWMWKRSIEVCLRILCFAQNSCGVVVGGRWLEV